MLRRVGQSGFTLIELVITVVVLGLVVSAITSLFISIQRAQLNTRYLESATYAAQSEIESLRNLNYNNLTPGETINFSSELPADLPSGSSGSVEISEPVNGLRRVDVTVHYNFNGGQQTVKLSSLIGVLGITQ